MGVPGAVALQPLLAACTLEHIALHVSGGVLGTSASSASASASAVLADGLRRNTTLTSMRFTVKESDPVTIDTTMTEADFSSRKLCPAGTRILAAFISRVCFQAEGALSKLKINSYWLPIQELKTATALDLSGKGLKAEDVIIAASFISVRKSHLRAWALTQIYFSPFAGQWGISIAEFVGQQLFRSRGQNCHRIICHCNCCLYHDLRIEFGWQWH
jgi:hypothetical protein